MQTSRQRRTLPNETRAQPVPLLFPPEQGVNWIVMTQPILVSECGLKSYRKYAADLAASKVRRGIPRMCLLLWDQQRVVYQAKKGHTNDSTTE